MRSVLHMALVGACGVTWGAGCSTVLGLSAYDFPPSSDATVTDARSSVDGGEDAEEGCGSDLTSECYRCAPATNEQFLNSCSEGACVPFDRTRLEGLLLPDGALPELPPDGG